jgi:membrane protease YdiL (CAAX protease family)
MAPAEVQAAQGRIAMPFVVRILYGGITEEVLLRWGFMTLLVWLAWRFIGRTRSWVWVAIAVSAFVFAAGHLPAAGILVGPLNAAIVGYVLVVNTFFGIGFGWLFWRYGLEAAIVAHALTHVVNFLIAG